MRPHHRTAILSLPDRQNYVLGVRSRPDKSLAEPCKQLNVRSIAQAALQVIRRDIPKVVPGPVMSGCSLMVVACTSPFASRGACKFIRGRTGLDNALGTTQRPQVPKLCCYELMIRVGYSNTGIGTWGGLASGPNVPGIGTCADLRTCAPFRHATGSREWPLQITMAPDHSIKHGPQ